MYRLTFLSLAFVLLTACNLNLEPKPQPNPGGDPCGAACSHLRDLGCEEGQPSPRRGVTCESVCDGGNGVDLHPECILTKRSCAAVQQCFSQ